MGRCSYIQHSDRHHLESVERYVIPRNLAYCIVFHLFHDSRKIIILVLLLLLYDIMSYIVCFMQITILCFNYGLRA